MSVVDVAEAHRREHRRNYARYGHDGVDKPKAEGMMEAMADKAGTLVGTSIEGMDVKTNDVVGYADQVDGIVSKYQGIRFIFTDGSRIMEVESVQNSALGSCSAHLLSQGLEDSPALFSQFESL